MIASSQQIDARFFGRIQQRAVLEALPSQFVRAHHLMPSQERARGAGVLASNRIFTQLP
jgi:hypothetical protein